MKTLLYLLLALAASLSGCKTEAVTAPPETVLYKGSKTKIIYPQYIVQPFGYDLTKTRIDFMKPVNDGC